MKRFLSFSLAAFAIVCVLLATERSAFASGYIDPGSGLLALQCITSVLAATGFYLRRRIRALFGPRKEAKPIVRGVAPSTGNPPTAA